MTRRPLLAVAAVALALSACGSSGHAVTTSRRAVSTPGGSLRAAIPSGWHAGLAAAAAHGYRPLYAAIGPRASGIAADVIITRAAARELKVGAIPAVELAGLHRETPANLGISRPRELTVDGAPAVAVDYMHLAAPGRLVFHETVDVLHGGWLYIVTCTGASAPAVTGALDRILSSWRWT
jgi:hypothetical protein